MNQGPTSLDRLHDIVLPPPVPWWPPAAGWYAVLGAALVLFATLVLRAWKQWRANAYRRAALRELAAARDAAAVAEILRCTALAAAPRSVVAPRIGRAWLGFLAERSGEPVPDAVAAQLTAGVYGRLDREPELGALRSYAARWIAHHRGSWPGEPRAG